jgi:hypothetical protein
MGVPTLEVGYTSATTGREEHEVHNGHVVALARKKVSSHHRRSWMELDIFGFLSVFLSLFYNSLALFFFIET